MNFDYVKEFMDEGVRGLHTPGCSIVIYQDNKEIYRYAVGSSDLSTGAPFTGLHHVNIFSCSKITTVVAGLKLLEQGKLRLIDRLSDYMPEFAHMKVRQADGTLKAAEKPILLRHLFTMTAGFNYEFDVPAFKKAKEVTGGRYDTVETIRCLAEEPLDFEPGTRWQYSLCHDVLAAVVEIVSGKKFRDYVREEIFEPLGMKDTVYCVNDRVLENLIPLYNYQTDAEMAQHKAAPADTDVSRSAQDPAKVFPADRGSFVEVSRFATYILGSEYDSGGAGITTTMDDYIKLISALANGGIGPNGAQILSAPAIELLRTPALTPELLKDFDWESMTGYNYGLGVRTLTDRSVGFSLSEPGEFGWGGAAGAMTYIQPEKKLAAFFVQNQLNPREEIYVSRLRNAIFAGLDRK